MFSSKERKISITGKCRSIDNIFIECLWEGVKYECVYLPVFKEGVQLYNGLDAFFHFYNTECFYQALNYETSESLYDNVV